MTITDVLTDHPARETFDLDELAACIDACLACTATCSSCADACLSEDDPAAMRRCIQTDLDCADICAATARVLARPSPTGHAWRALVEACAQACTECADECSQHDHAHCRRCADACRRCADACRALLAVAD